MVYLPRGHSQHPATSPRGCAGGRRHHRGRRTCAIPGQEGRRTLRARQAVRLGAAHGPCQEDAQPYRARATRQAREARRTHGHLAGLPHAALRRLAGRRAPQPERPTPTHQDPVHPYRRVARLSCAGAEQSSPLDDAVLQYSCLRCAPGTDQGRCAPGDRSSRAGRTQGRPRAGCRWQSVRATSQLPSGQLSPRDP